MSAQTLSAQTRDTRARWAQARRILAVRLDGLGDVLMTTPALAAIRNTLPGADITLLAAPASEALAPHLSVVDRIRGFAAPWMPGSADMADDRNAIAALQHGRHDAAVIFTVCTQSALPAALALRLAGIPLVAAHVRENPYRLLSDWVPDPDTALSASMRHEVQRQLDLVAAVGMRTADERLRFRVHDADRARVRARLAAGGVAPGARYAVLHPGATAESRRWPAERFGAVGRAIAARSGCAVVVSGDAGDRDRVRATRAAMGDVPALALAGELSLGELAALIDGAALLVANNSLAAHLAAAVATPVVVLYAQTNPQHVPWQAQSRVLVHDVPCRWCLKSRCPQGHHACLLEVGADLAADAAIDLLHDHKEAVQP